MDEQYQGGAGVRYLWQSYHGLAELLHAAHAARSAGPPGEPALGKRYEGLAIERLPAQMPLTLGDPRAAFPAYRAAQAPPPEGAPLSLGRLAQLLYYTYGISRHDVGSGVEWPIHRVVPSARCRFPVELYLWLPEGGPAPAGCYHYDGPHHQLARLRGGDYRTPLSRALARSLEGSVGALLVATAFGKTASYYFDFAYRLCTQEAGVVVGSSLMVAGALGLHARVSYTFLDDPLNRLLGLDGADEAVLAAITLSGGEAAGAPPAACDSATLCRQIAPIAPAVRGEAALDPERCAQLLTLDRLARLERSEGLPRRVAPARVAPAGPPTIPFAAPPAVPRDLAAALHARTSGDTFFQPRSAPVEQAALLEAVRYALEPADDDLGGDLSCLRLFVVVSHVAETAPGVYELGGAAGGLHLLRAGRLAEELRRAQPMMRCDTAAAVCYIVGAYAPLTEALGERAYRALQIQAGLVAQRLCAMSATFGMAARLSDSYRLESVIELLGLGESAWLPLLQVAIGAEAPGCGGAERYRLSIRF